MMERQQQTYLKNIEIKEQDMATKLEHQKILVH